MWVVAFVHERVVRVFVQVSCASRALWATPMPTSTYRYEATERLTSISMPACLRHVSVPLSLSLSLCVCVCVCVQSEALRPATSLKVEVELPGVVSQSASCLARHTLLDWGCVVL